MILIHTALFFEANPIIQYLKLHFVTKKPFKMYQNDKYILIISGIGGQNTIKALGYVYEKYAINYAINIGIAGTKDKQLKIGDLIVANQLSQHDLDITAFGHPFGYVPGGEVFVKTDDRLKNIALEVALKNNIKIIEGTIATGDQFVADEKRKNFIKNTFNADALEMEGASVAVVCDVLNVPCLILRAISDTADMDAGFNFDEFLKSSAKTSAKFVFEMLNMME